MKSSGVVQWSGVEWSGCGVERCNDRSEVEWIGVWVERCRGELDWWIGVERNGDGEKRCGGAVK